MKSVEFNENFNKVHHIIVWEFAHRKARETYWEFFAVDRLRFQRRIHRAAEVLDKILDLKHRQTVFNNRFYNSL